MYRVKLADKSSEEITIDGITITHKWTGIIKKTNSLEELEKEGKIIIEDVKDEEQTKHSYSDVQAELAGILDGSKFREIQAELVRILDGSKFRDAQLKIATMLSDSLMEVKRVDKSRTKPKAQKEQNKVEQKPISTEQKFIDIKKEIESVSKIKNNDYKSLLETVEKIVVKIDALTSRIDEYENTKDIKPDAIKKAVIKKIAWMKSRKQLVFIIQQLYDEGFLLIDENIDNMITNHFITIEDKSLRKDGDIKRIRWVGTLSTLGFFIDQLYNDKFLSQSEIFEIDNFIYNHFGDREGNPFNKGSIKATRNRYNDVNKYGMPKGGEKILEIIKKAKNIKE